MSDLPATFVPGFHDENAVRKMQYRDFGNTGMKVSQLALGTATFSYLFGEYTLEECRATVLEALKKGVNYIDTAPYYGHGVSEEVLGKCLEGIPRQAYYLATKVARYGKEPEAMFDFSAKKTQASIETSLKRLKVDYVDVLQIHDVEFAPSVDYVLNETLPVVKAAKDAGKARFIGVTGYPVAFLAELVKKSPIPLDTVLSYSRYNLLDSKLKEFIPFFKSKNLAIINAAIHCQGLLTNKGPQDWQSACKEMKDACRHAGDLCSKNGFELGKLAAHYAFTREGSSTNLIGINTREVLNFNLDPCVNGISAKESDFLNYLLDNVFSELKKTDWEQVEIDAYQAALKKGSW